MKRKEKEKIKLPQKKLKQILNKNRNKPIEIRTNVNKIKKMQISKTHSMENISNISKNTTRVKSQRKQKIINNSMEEFDYLNFSDIDLDCFKKDTSFDEDIFNPEYKNKLEKKLIVQNRYNMIDTSFNTIKSQYIITESECGYIDTKKNILLKTPSTICNYYEKSEICSEKKKKNSKINKNDELGLKYKKLKNKSIQISNNNKNHTLYNHPIYSNRIKPTKNFSTSNLKLTHYNNKNYSKTKTNFYKSKGNTINYKGRSKKRTKDENVSSSILKKRNKENNNYLFDKLENNSNLVENYLKNNLSKNKSNSNKIINQKKSFSTKKYSGNMTSQIIHNNNNKAFTNFTFTYNNDFSNYLNKKRNISNLLKSTKDNKEIKENINNNTVKENGSLNQQEIIINNNKCQSQQKPIMLCLDKNKFNSYFINPNSSNSEKKEIQNNDINFNYNNYTYKDNDKDYLNVNINNITEKYTGRNNPIFFNDMKKGIIVKRKKLNKTNNIESCIKSIYVNINNNSNTGLVEYNDNQQRIKVNLKKHIKSSSELMKFINVDKKNENIKNKKNNKKIKNNKSFVNICSKGIINTSQVIKDLPSKKKIMKSPSQKKNNNLRNSKTIKDNNNNITNKIKTTPKYNKIHKRETFSTIEKKNYIGSNQKGYYASRYELNLKNNNNSNVAKNKINKNSFKPKTQSDIKINKYSIKDIKEEEYSKKSNKENIDNNEYGMDKRVKQKLLDRMNKASKNSLGIILGTYQLSKANAEEAFCDIMKSPNKEFIFTNKFSNNNKIISNENSKNDEKDYNKKYDKRNLKETAIIKEYKIYSISNAYM